MCRSALICRVPHGRPFLVPMTTHAEPNWNLTCRWEPSFKNYNRSWFYQFRYPEGFQIIKNVLSVNFILSYSSPVQEFRPGPFPWENPRMEFPSRIGAQAFASSLFVLFFLPESARWNCCTHFLSHPVPFRPKNAPAWAEPEFTNRAVLRVSAEGFFFPIRPLLKAVPPTLSTPCERFPHRSPPGHGPPRRCAPIEAKIHVRGLQGETGKSLKLEMANIGGLPSNFSLYPPPFLKFAGFCPHSGRCSGRRRVRWEFQNHPVFKLLVKRQEIHRIVCRANGADVSFFPRSSFANGYSFVLGSFFSEHVS